MDRDHNKMEEAKLGKACLPDSLCCPGDQRQMLDNIGVMQPLTIKTEQAKRSCNSCLTNSPKKVAKMDINTAIFFVRNCYFFFGSLGFFIISNTLG